MNSCIEVRCSSSSKERIQLDESFNIGISCFGFSNPSVSNSAASD